MKIAIIGAGNVGTTIGKQLHQSGHEIQYGVREPASEITTAMLAANPGTTAATVPYAISWADVMILATPGANDDAGIQKLAQMFDEGAAGKVLIDATNPLTPYPGLAVRWGKDTSGAEVLQAALPDVKVFKAWNTLGQNLMEVPDGSTLGGQKLTLLFAGDDKASAELVREVVAASGFEPVYVGPLRYSRNMEAIAELWIHMGNFNTGDPVGRNFHFQVIKK